MTIVFVSFIYFSNDDAVFLESLKRGFFFFFGKLDNFIQLGRRNRNISDRAQPDKFMAIHVRKKNIQNTKGKGIIIQNIIIMRSD